MFLVHLRVGFQVLACLLALLTDCKAQQGKIQALEISMNGFSLGDGFFRIFFIGDIRVYEGYYRHKSSVNTYIYDSITQKQTVQRSGIASESRRDYFVFHKDSALGLSFDPLSPQSHLKMFSVDSMQNVIGFTPNLKEEDRLLTSSPDSSIWDKRRTVLKEVYEVKAINGKPRFTNRNYYSREFDEYPHSFSRRIDSARGIKVYKLETYIPKFFDSATNSEWPSVLVSIEMRRTKVDYEDEILKMVSIYLDKTKIKTSQPAQ